MDSLIAVRGADFVVMAADSSQLRSVLVVKSGSESKIMDLDEHKLLGAVGDHGDRVHFTEYLQKNFTLYEMRTGRQLGVQECANWTRSQLATALRSGPYQTNLLLAGVDDDKRASLYFIDYLASMQSLPFACQGYAGHFLLGLLDRGYRADMSRDEAVSLVRSCIAQLTRRFLVNSPHFQIKVVDADGIHVLEDGVARNDGNDAPPSANAAAAGTTTATTTTTTTAIDAGSSSSGRSRGSGSGGGGGGRGDGRQYIIITTTIDDTTTTTITTTTTTTTTTTNRPTDRRLPPPSLIITISPTDMQKEQRRRAHTRARAPHQNTTNHHRIDTRPTTRRGRRRPPKKNAKKATKTRKTN